METLGPTSVHIEDEENDRPSKKPRREQVDQNKSGIREIGLMRASDDGNYASFLGSASGIHFIRSVYTAAAGREPRDARPNQTPSSDLVPGEDDRLQGGVSGSFDTTLWHPNEISSRAGRDRFMYEDMLSWTKSYFNNWHAAYPFLHGPSILESFERLAQGLKLGDSDDENVIKLAIVRSIMSISLADRRQSANLGDPVPSFLVFQSFKHATDSIQLALSTKTSILSLQAVVAVQLFLVSMLRHNAASRLGGLITRMVFHLGLHRCPARYPSFSRDEVQLRQRLFWSVYCIDRHVCQSLGLPLTLRDDDLDVCFLDHERHAQVHDGFPDLDPRLQLLNLLSKQAEIKGLIIELLHKSIPYRHADDKRSTSIDAKLARWSNAVDTYLDREHETLNLLSDFHELLLGILKSECVIALNRPLLAASKRDDRYSSAMQTCIAASRFIITNMQKFITPSQRNKESADRISATPLLWPSFTWAVWMSAFILLFAAIEDELPSDVALRLTDRGMEVLRHLSIRGSVWPSACEVAIRELRAKLVRTLPLASGVNNTNNEADAALTAQTHASTGKANVMPDSVSHRIATSDALPQQQESSIRTTNGDEGQHHTSKRPVPYGLDAMGPTNGFREADVPPFSFDSHGSTEQVTPWPANGAISAFEDIDLFQGFEIPFWMGDDQYNSLMNN